MNDSGEAPDINMLNQLKAIADGGDAAAAVTDATPAAAAGVPADDLTQTQASETVANAADLITKESDEKEIPLESDDNL